MAKGLLTIETYNQNTLIPFPDARVTITPLSPVGNPLSPIQFVTNNIGRTESIELAAPPKEESLQPTGNAPYSTANITIEASGYTPVNILGTQILADEESIQAVELYPSSNFRQNDVIIIEITGVRLNSDLPNKIPEDPMKPLESRPGFVVLPEPVVPEFIVVHAGTPDSTATNYKVRFADYIKNVVCSEIYATWPENALRANILCILSFTMNRIYTEWYRSKGKDFQITNSTAYDQYFVYGRNIYRNVNNLVDELFTNYVKRPGSNQPLLTQYCDGNNVTCPGWLSQWGSKAQADLGKTPMEILKYYYGNNLVLDSAKKVGGVPESYPGRPLRRGSSGQSVRTIQEQLNRISQAYPLIPKLAVDGQFGPATEKSVKTFQQVFGLTPDGIVGLQTWYRISKIYTAVAKLAELRYDPFITKLDELSYNTLSRNNIFKEKKFIPPTISSLRSSIPTATYNDED